MSKIFLTSTSTAKQENQKKRKLEETIKIDDDSEEDSDSESWQSGGPVLVDDQSVIVADLKRLEPGQYLNDTIIDFYLNYLKEQVLPSDDRDGVHIFTTIFYACLKTADKRNREEIPAREKRHLAVARWTKSVNIFQKNLLVFPICTNSHWFLIVVVKPGLIVCPDEKNNNGEPSIIVLDSLGGSQGTSVRLIREYLAEEWRTRMSPSDGRTISFSEKQIKTLVPKKVIIVIVVKVSR